MGGFFLVNMFSILLNYKHPNWFLFQLLSCVSFVCFQAARKSVCLLCVLMALFVCFPFGWLLFVLMLSLCVVHVALFVCPPSLSFASTVSPLVVADSGFLRLLFLYYVWIGPRFLAWKLFVFFLQFLSMLLSKYAFYLLIVCFHSKQKQQDELKQPKQLLFCGRTSHWCKHEEQQQLEEGERKLDLWRLDFRTWL